MPANTGKRTVGGSIVPRLINNKQKHLERNLAAAQRDQLFMKKMKNDAEFRKDLQTVRKGIHRVADWKQRWRTYFDSFALLFYLCQYLLLRVLCYYRFFQN